MSQFNDEELSTWLSVNNHPSLYMHKQWWEKLSIEHMLQLFQSNDSAVLHIKINLHIINIMKLSMIPWPHGSDNQENMFWIKHFFFKKIALLIGLLLQKNPIAAFMSGEVYRYIKQTLPVDKARLVMVNGSFIANKVISFSQDHFDFGEGIVSVAAAEEVGKTVLTNAVCPELKERINILFSPGLEQDGPIEMNLDHQQQLQVQYLVKRLIHLCGFSGATPQQTATIE